MVRVRNSSLYSVTRVSCQGVSLSVHNHSLAAGLHQTVSNIELDKSNSAWMDEEILTSPAGAPSGWAPSGQSEK